MARQLERIVARGKALIKLPGMGRDLVRRIPEPVQIGLSKAGKRSLIYSLELLGGLLIIGGVMAALLYGRLSQGPLPLTFLAPNFEAAINRELAGLSIKVGDFTMERDPSALGISFRLKNVRLFDENGAIVAQAPAAAIGLSGRALLWGDLAPGSVDFIGPRLLLFHSPETGLALTFSRETEELPPAGQAPPDTVPPQAQGGESRMPRETGAPGFGFEPGTVSAPSRQIDLVESLTAAFERARRGTNASSYLTRFGVRDAIVIFDQNGKRSFWQVPDFSFDLEHKQKRSILLGHANIKSADGPWQVKFRTEQSEKEQRLTFTTLIQDLIPTSIAANLPGLPGLGALNLPFDAETSIHVSSEGELLGAEARLNLKAGHIIAPWDLKHPMLIDEGDLHIRYQTSDDHIDILPSVIQWGESRARISGEMIPTVEDDRFTSWSFELKGDESVLAATEFGVPPFNVDVWSAKGIYYPDSESIDLKEFVLRIGNASISLSGTIANGEGSPAAKLKGQISAMPVAMLKLMWPKFLAAGAREWVGERVTAGEVTGGTFEVDLPPGLIPQLEQGVEVPDSVFRFFAQGKGLEISYIPGLPPLTTGDATLQIEGRKFLMAVPSGHVSLPSGREIALEDGSLSIADLRPDPQTGVIDFKMKAPVGAALELLDQEPLGYIREIGMQPDDLAGRTEGRFLVRLPLKKDVEFSEISLKGDADVREANLTKKVGSIGVEGGALTLNVTEQALEARGDILLNGVPAELSWQRIFGAPEDKQPELRITMQLDQNERKRLGLETGEALRGPVSTILSIRNGPDKKPKYRVRADLSQADLIMSAMGWRKPPGRDAILTFDIGQNAKGETELQNFNVEGQEIGIEGWIALDGANEPRAFYFPQFSVNTITRMEIAGEKGSDGVWDVRAEGSAYDGRQFFKSLFSAGQLADDVAKPPEDSGNVNLTAKVGAVVGYFDTTVSDMSIKAKKREGRLVDLDVSGKLNGKAPIAARLVHGEGQERVVLAEAEDAGAAFRLVGFYPRMEGGQTSLQVNLDASGPASKAGILWAKDFNVLGDRVVSEVLSNSGDDPLVNFGELRRMGARRQRIAFDQLRVPFSVGGGRFELHDSYINGPKLGATVRGYVDFKSQFMEIGGTYIPAYGLNSALGSIPVIGNLLVGRRGEGVLGITFAIKGPANDPDVMVNPVSMVAPGIFRQIFEYTGRSPESFPEPVEQQQQQMPQARRSNQIQ